MQGATYRIPVKKGDETHWALVDPEDHARMSSFNWFLHSSGRYAIRNEGSWRRGTHRMVSMHRDVLGLVPSDGTEVDHKNRNPLDNRKANLRVVTHARNMCNLGSRAGSSRFRGVSWDKDRSLWKATASPNGRQQALGRFAREEDAAAAVNAFWASLGYETPNDLAA